MVLAGVWSSLTDAWQAEMADWGEAASIVRVLVRMVIALLLGGLLGMQREHEHKPAGLRTHMLVSLGAALVIAVPRMSGFASHELSRIIQGVLAGIGFVGGGAILKLSNEEMVTGVTTAATIWVAAAIGIAVGLGRVWDALFAALLSLAILTLIGHIKYRHAKQEGKKPPGSAV